MLFVAKLRHSPSAAGLAWYWLTFVVVSIDKNFLLFDLLDMCLLLLIGYCCCFDIDYYLLLLVNFDKCLFFLILICYCLLMLISNGCYCWLLMLITVCYCLSMSKVQNAWIKFFLWLPFFLVGNVFFYYLTFIITG